MTSIHTGRRDFAIINRSFWPIYPVIGEALLRLAEDLSSDYRVSVVMQDHVGIKDRLKEENRGRNVEFLPAKAWSNSSSGVFLRALDAVYFMLWVFWSLLKCRPRMVYVSTDPPVLVPFAVMVYAALFKAQYIYHLQDVHPEAANVVMRVNPLLFRLLRWMDSITMRRATALITITQEMAEEIQKRSETKSPLYVVNNPAVSFDDVQHPPEKIRGFSFCGNAGRLQRIPLLTAAIRRYLSEGGTLKFGFAGGGVYAPDIDQLARHYENVDFLGLVSASQAAQLNCDYEWALLPIEDEVTRFAFPSKSSSYVFSGAAVLAICGRQTSVAEWTLGNNLGVVVAPDEDSLVETFLKVERGELDASDHVVDRSVLKAQLNFDYFLARLKEIIPLQVTS